MNEAHKVAGSLRLLVTQAIFRIGLVHPIDIWNGIRTDILCVVSILQTKGAFKQARAL